MQGALNFVQNGASDPLSAALPIARYGVLPGSDFVAPVPTYQATLFYNTGSLPASSPAPKDTSFKPPILSDWQGGLLPSANGTDSLLPLTMGAWSQLHSPQFAQGGPAQGKFQSFHVVPLAADMDAMNMLHDIVFDTAKALDVTSLKDFFVGVAFNSITTTWLDVSLAGVGSPMDVSNSEPFFQVEVATTWAEEGDSEKVRAFVGDVERQVQEKIKPMGGLRDYKYLNDADVTQDVFAGYPESNVRRMQGIRDRYDPERVFTDLMKGGFKVADCKGGVRPSYVRPRSR